MRHVSSLWLIGLVALAACGKVPLEVYPGEAVAQSARNTPPLVSAGADVTLQWPTAEVELAGTVTDDGLPATGKLQRSWSSATPGVTFGNPLSAQTSARFAATGTYTLTLIGNDGALSVNDSIVVTVLPERAPNTAPIADAGADQTIELPLEVVLRGSATDDGAPASAVEFQWTLRNGPGEVTFENAVAAQTTAAFTAPGVYELLLTVSDSELTGTDVLSVVVHAAVYPAPDLSDDDPDRGWVRVPPADVGMDEAPLAEAERYALEAGGAGMIVRNGRLVRSWGQIDQRFDIKSTTKSIGALALALALDENRLRLEDRASAHLPTFGRPPQTNDAEHVGQITLLQLATHTAGFEKTGGYGRLLAEPGSEWRYSDGGLNWLADVLTSVHAQDLRQVFVHRVWPVIGVSGRDDVRWRPASSGFRREPRDNGIEHREFASGMIANVNALARVGLLYLRRGIWGGQRVFSESFVDLVSTPRPEAATATNVEPLEYPDANHRFGVLWWTNATGALPEVPRDAYWAWGLGDSLIVVIPSLDLVIARAGVIQSPSPDRRHFGDNDWNGDYSVLEPFLNPIVHAVR